MHNCLSASKIGDRRFPSAREAPVVSRTDYQRNTAQHVSGMALVEMAGRDGV